MTFLPATLAWLPEAPLLCGALAAVLSVPWWLDRRQRRLDEEQRVEDGIKLIRVTDPPRVVEVGDVPIVPGRPVDTLPPIVIGSLTFPRRHPALHRHIGAHRATGFRIGGRRSPEPLPRPNPAAPARTVPGPARVRHEPHRTCPPIRDWAPTVCTTLRHEQQARQWLGQILDEMTQPWDVRELEAVGV